MDPAARTALHRADPRARARRVRRRRPAPPTAGSIGSVASRPPRTALRDALEDAYRALAREADELEDRVELVNQANAVRNRTLV